MSNKTETEKIKWLQNHYKNYGTRWYASNPARLEALFKREYKKFISQEVLSVQREQEKQIQENVSGMKITYRNVYGIDFDDDLKDNRKRTLEKVQSISKLWLK